MVPSVIGEDLTVEGNVISKGEVQLEGEIKGDCRCASLVIGDKALIEGDVLADDVYVRGRVVGSIRGHRVTLQSSCHVEGDIFHQSLAIEQGAYFEGKRVWTWKVKGKLDKALYKPVRSEKRPSYAHTNAVIRLDDGDTIISLRNFNRVVRVSPGGEIKKVWGPIARVHEPNLLPDGTLVASPHRRKPRGHSVIAISADGEKRRIYKNALGILPIRTVEILGNGNYLLTGGEEIVEINDEGTVVWHVAIYSKSQSSQPQKRPRRRAQQGKRGGKRGAGGRNSKKRGTGGGRSDERGVYKAVWVGSRR